MSHAAWNLLRRIEKGNTSATATPNLARALRRKHRVAVWCTPMPDEDFPPGWYTAKIIDPQTQNHDQHLVQYDADNSTCEHLLTPVAGRAASAGRDRWLPAPPPETPPCPACGAATKGGTGAGGMAAYTYTHYHAKVARLSYTCVSCDRKCTAKNPATLARTDPSSPHITEPLDCRPTPVPAPKPPPPSRPAGARQSPRLNPPLAAPAPGAQDHGAEATQAAQASPRPPPSPPRGQPTTETTPIPGPASRTRHLHTTTRMA